MYKFNSGNRNSGDCNSGNRNSGDCNSGNRNSGDWNSGNLNSGTRNSGTRNSGDCNSGTRNSGDCNSGNWNSGNWNSGDCNSGKWNSGNWNSGDWNSGDRNSGYCNSNNPKVRIFDKTTNKKIEEIDFPDYFFFDLNVWINIDSMTKEEKKKYWWYKTTNGFLRKIEFKEAWQKSFEKAIKEDVKKTLNLPNFDYKIFKKISGITKKMINAKLKE